MSNPAQIERASYDSMLYGIQKASIYNKGEFQKTPLARAEQKMLAMVQAVAKKERQDFEDEDRYTLPAELTVEQHLFNLTFGDKARPIKVIDHAFRQYNPAYGYWETIPDEQLEQRVLANAEKAHYPPNKNGIAKSMATAANVDKAMKFAGKKLFYSSNVVNNKHLIAFKNFTVCTKTGQAREHDPSYHITTCLPYDYHPGAECPEPMLRYIRSSFGEGQEEYVRAALGLMLDLTAPDRFVHACGPSGSGKGVFTRLVMKFFGQESVGSPNNFKLFAQPDQVHQYLSGKRLIAIDDIVGFVGEEIGRFYTAVERTAMNARCLFKPKGYTQQFDIRYTVASVGQLPTKYSNSKGWSRRVFPLPTTASQMADDNLEQELENCIADIISWALAQDKARRNAILKNPERYNDGAAEYFREAQFSSSSAWAFIDECLTPVDPTAIDIAAAQTVDEGRIYTAYKAYCAATGRQPMGLDGLKHEFRQALPLNWVDRKGKGGRIPRRFVYMALKETAFDFGDIGATCNLSNLGYDGVADFKEWAIKFGGLHPYGPDELATMGAEPEPTPPPAAAPPDVAPQPEPVAPPPPAPEPPPPIAPDQGCRDGDGNVIHAWITPGKPEWWQAFEQRLIEATTIEQLQEAKKKTSASRRTQIMNTWSDDGRYEWLKAKAARLEAEAMEVEQGQLT
jgi:phage/plasmid-associated DNA primase